MHKYSEEELEFIKNNAIHNTDRELTELFNNKFNLNLSREQIKNARFRKVGIIKSENKGCFKKGQVPFNKGKKQIEYMTVDGINKSKLTRFKKGNSPKNTKPIGSEKITKDFYICVKVGQPDKWVLKHRLIYENVNGKIPQNHKLIFADGNIRNFDINNLILISDEEHLILNQKKLRSNNADITKTSCTLAKLINVRRKKIKR